MLWIFDLLTDLCKKQISFSGGPNMSHLTLYFHFVCHSIDILLRYRYQYYSQTPKIEPFLCNLISIKAPIQQHFSIWLELYIFTLTSWPSASNWSPIEICVFERVYAQAEFIFIFELYFVVVTVLLCWQISFLFSFFFLAHFCGMPFAAMW